MKSKTIYYWMLVFSLIAVSATSAPWVSTVMAQTADTGALTGTITDPSGAVIPGAQIEAISIATGATRTAVSGNNGSYRIALLPPGSYNVRISMSGFQTAEFLSVVINV
ncbi:MAG TPA: carboxypeptidase-like regulatory domain-containing protein, partial [Acidobacteriota bacterium]|nr:carboxypeptidase-like regulatory domain-containing protein [Acidobacteriota bacterium]